VAESAEEPVVIARVLPRPMHVDDLARAAAEDEVDGENALQLLHRDAVSLSWASAVAHLIDSSLVGLRNAGPLGPGVLRMSPGLV
jgi:hypothetical protein